MQGRTRYSKIKTKEEIAAARRRRIVVILILVAVIGLAVLGINRLINVNTTTEMTAHLIPCGSDREIGVMGSNIIYYESGALYCCNTDGGIRWSVPMGGQMSFSCSDTHVIAWDETMVYIVNENGRTTYSQAMTDTVQFARVGQAYAAIVIGSDTKPDVLVKDLQGNQVDEENEAFDGMMMLDVGFYGSQGQYLWTLAMDVYNTAVNSVLNTFEVSKMNTGEKSMGEHIAYKVLFENNRLRVFTTQEMQTFDYKLTASSVGTVLTYGWKYIASYIPERGDGMLLMAPMEQTTGSQNIKSLRLLSGTDKDQRFLLPEACLGAFADGKYVYAVSDTKIYRSVNDKQQFYPYSLPLGSGVIANSVLGITANGYVLIAAGPQVYAVTLPK